MTKQQKRLVRCPQCDKNAPLVREDRLQRHIQTVHKRDREYSSTLSIEAQQHLEQAYSYDEQNDLENAQRECELAIRLAPDCAEAHNLLGIVLDELGKGEQAIVAYRRAVRLNPDFQDAQDNLREAEAESRDERGQKSAPKKSELAEEYEYGGFLGRAIALVIDSLILSLPIVLLVLLVGALDSFAPPYQPSMLGGLRYGFALLLRLLGSQLGEIAYMGAYFVLSWHGWGQTPGMKIMGLEVITSSGEPPDLWTAVKRYVGFVLSAGVLFLGFLWALWDKEKRGWHDKIAGTYVIRRRSG